MKLKTAGKVIKIAIMTVLIYIAIISIIYRLMYPQYTEVDVFLKLYKIIIFDWD